MDDPIAIAPGSDTHRTGRLNDLIMRKLELILWTILLWSIASCVYAYYYVVTILALPEDYDAYARNWKFQLLAFSLVRLPWLVLALAVVVGVIIVLPNRKTLGHLPTDVSAK